MTLELPMSFLCDRKARPPVLSLKEFKLERGGPTKRL